MSDPVDALILDLIEWIGPRPRPYREVIEVWRTSCPRLPVWEDANDRGFVEHDHPEGAEAMVSVSPLGAAFLVEHRRRTPQPLYSAREEMTSRVGVVIPAWFAADTPVEEAERLLLTTLAGSPACLSPASVAVVADGSEVARVAAERLLIRLRGEWGTGFQLIELPENQGKGAALAAGIRALLEGEVTWIAARDADGDHLLDDLPHLYRAGEQLAAECPGRPACVIGRRASVHAPLGWVRGEFELLLNEVLVDGIAFALAREGAAWDTRYLAGRAPDLQSGYKLYSRDAARLAVEALEGEAVRSPELGLLRVGMEIVPFVALALAGAAFAETERKSYFDQPVTSYGRVDMARFYGSKLAWALRRCGVSPTAAALMLDGAAVRRPLFTDPEGRAMLLALRTIVLDFLSGGRWPEGVPVEPRMRTFL